MTNFSRRAKSGNEWTQDDLRAYNIQVVELSFADFFHQNEFPSVPLALRHFCEITDQKLAPDDETYKLLHYLDLAHNHKVDQAAVDIFAARLLKRLGYATGRRIFITRQVLPLIICGTKHTAQTEVCLCDVNDYLLLVQQNKQLDNPDDLEPQLIAEAITAYQRNNFTRDRVLQIPVLNKVTFPSITLVGTSPTFHKIKITAKLNDTMMGGIFPGDPILVYQHTPKLPCRNREGMKPLENRSVILQHYQAFKAFV